VFVMALCILVRPPRVGANVFLVPVQWTEYHAYSEFVAGLQTLSSSPIAWLDAVGFSVEGRPIWAIKISDYPNLKEPHEPDVLFVGLHHAREWISAEVPYYFAWKLVELYDSDPVVRRCVDNCEIWIVPVLNPDGLEFSRGYFECTECPGENSRYWRRNRVNNGDGSFGVDLNRNYGTFNWGQDVAEGIADGSPNTTDVTYWGPSAFSEPETVAMRDLILDVENDFQAVVSYHSYWQMIAYPWGYTPDPPVDASSMEVLSQGMAATIQAVHGEEYTVIQAGATYLTVGDMGDWVYEQKGIPGLTIELRPDNPEFDLVNFELPEDEILTTCEENWAAALFLMNWVLAQHPLTPTDWGSILLTYGPVIAGGTAIIIACVVFVIVVYRRRNSV
jgi:murein tripeptide amidase MpaA